MAVINGIETRKYQLSYDKIIKNTLAQSDEMTIRFVNGLFGDDIPLDATVAWLDKESVNDKHVGFVADFYPQIAGRMYHIEVEQDDNGDMAVRVFKYSLGGAILHGMTATDAELSVTFPQPCVIFLKSGANTPTSLRWNIQFFDGQHVTLQIPTIRLAEMSVETIRITVENTVSRSRKEAGLTMTSNIMETLPWIDYSEVFEKLEERGKAEGKAEGRAERDMEIAGRAFNRVKTGANPAVISRSLLELGIPESIIEAARKQAETERVQARKRGEPESER